MRAFYILSIVTSLALGQSVASAAGVAPAAASPVQREQAQSRFLKGRDLYNAKKYDAALSELSASLDIVASPNTRLYLGRCLRDMGRTVAAYVELGRTAVEAKELVRDDTRYEKAAVAAQEERTQLLPKLGFAEVRVVHASDATVLKVSGEEIRRGGWEEPLPVLPGTTTIRLETPDHAPVEQEVTIAAGEHRALTLDAGADGPIAPSVSATVTLPTHHEGGSLVRPLAFATAGVAVAGLTTFIIAGLLSNKTYSDLESACGTSRCPPGHEGDISTGKTQQTFANVGLGVFVVSAAASTTLFVIGAKSKSSARVGPGTLSVAGTF